VRQSRDAVVPKRRRRQHEHAVRCACEANDSSDNAFEHDFVLDDLAKMAR
jgi:hypothetical protein